MAKHENNRLRVQGADYIAIVTFAILLALAVICGKYKADINDLYNIEKTEVDYIIPAPSKEQVREIADLQSVEVVVPYLYRSVKYNGISTNLYILESEQSLDHTMFAEDLLIKKTGKEVANPLYISDDFAAAAKLSLGNSIPLMIEGKEIDFHVDSIYKSDHRNVGGSIYAIMQDVLSAAINEKYGESYRYSGAFICCSDSDSFNDYLKNYVPEGDLREASEFENDELYQVYLKEHSSADYRRESTDLAALSRDIHNRNDTKRMRFNILMYVSAVLGVIVMAVFILRKALTYIKEDVIKDIRNNFTLAQEHSMFQRYINTYWIIALALSVIAVVVNIVLNGALWSAFNVISILLVIAVAFGTGFFIVNTLQTDFTRKKAIVDEEKRREEEAKKRREEEAKKRREEEAKERVQEASEE